MSARRLAAAVCLALVSCRGGVACRGGACVEPPAAAPRPTTTTTTLPEPKEGRVPWLPWLMEVQREDGSFSAADAPPCAPTDDVCATALVLHAFSSEGYTHRSEGPGGRAVLKAARWLRAQQREDGRFGAVGAGSSLRRDALATSAVLTVYGLTGSTMWPKAAQRGLDALAASRSCWIPRAFPVSDDALETFAWAALAFGIAREIVRYDERNSRPPTLHPDPTALEDSRRQLAALREDGAAATPTARALRTALTRALGNGPQDLGLLARDLSALTDTPASPDEPTNDLPARAIAFATMASQVRGLGKTYSRWADRARAWVLSSGRWHARETPSPSAQRRALGTGSVETVAYGVLAMPPICSAYFPAFPGMEDDDERPHEPPDGPAPESRPSKD